MPDESADRNPVEILAEDFLARQRLGEKPALAEYLARYPDLAAEIEELFPVLVEMEDARLGNDEPPPPPVDRLGDYRILREVGRGGMGVVYEAEQESLARRVALKVLRNGTSTPQQTRRFESEARSAAKLHHTNIVPVFGVGQESGVHYYVMQFIPGQPLDEVLKEVRRLRHTGAASYGMPAGSIERLHDERPAARDVALTLVCGLTPAASGPASQSADGAAASTVTMSGLDSTPEIPTPPEPLAQSSL
jgi:hypothetical protein